MAKDPIDLAGFDAENTGGLLSGFLAEEDEFDRRSLWRLGAWGVAAVTAVIVALMANQSSFGSRHDQVAAADLARQSQQIQTVARESQNEARRLASAIDTLNGDRDRLYSRLTVLEHGLDSVTGTIARQVPAAPPEAVQTANLAPSPAATTSSPAAPPPATPPTSMPSPMMQTSAMSAPGPVAEEPSPPVQNLPSPPPSPPVMSPVATTPATPAEKTLSETTVADPGPATAASITPTAPTVSAASPASARTAPQATARPTTPRAPKAATARPSYATAKPPVVHLAPPEKPPSLIAAAPIPEVVASAEAAAKTGPDEQTLPPVAIQRTEFGVDVGGANSVNGLRALWRGLLKSRSNARLAALQPIIVIKESKTGLGMQLRLVAGPFSDAAEAAKICAGMAEHQRPCETTVFDGQRLVMKADETPAPSPATAAEKLPETAKPAAHRHVNAKPVTPEEPPPPAEPPPLSFFGMRIGSGQ
jgi:hypothetical protein